MRPMTPRISGMRKLALRGWERSWRTTRRAATATPTRMEIRVVDVTCPTLGPAGPRRQGRASRLAHEIRHAGPGVRQVRLKLQVAVKYALIIVSYCALQVLKRAASG